VKSLGRNTRSWFYIGKKSGIIKINELSRHDIIVELSIILEKVVDN